MADWLDVCALVLTTLFFVGVILGVLYATNALSSHVESTKATLERRGITLSREGVAFKTHKTFDREAYLDATQSGLLKALGAVTVGSESHKHTLLPHDEQRKHLFGHHLGAALRSRTQSDERVEEEH